MKSEKYYSIAGVCYRVFGDRQSMDFDDGVLEEYRTDECKADAEIELSLVSELSAPYGKQVFADGYIQVYDNSGAQIKYIGTSGNCLECAYMRIERKGKESKVQISRQKSGSRIVLNSMELEHNIALKGGFLLHSAFIAVNGKAILFTAPSGVGKSTQADLWVKYKGARLINGDRCAIVAGNEGVFACGVPFCGSSGVRKNLTYPLAAIVCLVQAQENSIEEFKGIAAFKKVREGCSVDLWSKDCLSNVTDTIIRVLEKVPVYKLDCLPDEGAVELLAKALQGRI